MAGVQQQPAVIGDNNIIPGFINANRKKYNGVPYHEFVNDFFTPFLNALGNIWMDGNSMRETYEETDRGGVNWGGAAPNAAQD